MTDFISISTIFDYSAAKVTHFFDKNKFFTIFLLFFSKNIWKLPYLLLPLHRQKNHRGRSVAVVSGIFSCLSLWEE